MKSNLFLLILLALLANNIVSCKKEDIPYVPVEVCADLSNKKDAIDQYLQGNWMWLQDKAYFYGGEVFYKTPKTEKFWEKVTIDATQITFLRTKIVTLEKETTVFNYRILPEGDLTTIPSDIVWVLAIYDIANGNLLNWWRIYICKNDLILASAYRGELYPDVTYQRQ